MSVCAGCSVGAASRPRPVRAHRPLCWPQSLLLALALGACATVPPSAGNNPADPLERVNRHVYDFNDRFDRAVAQPVARGYTAVVPRPARDCVANVFANVGEVTNIVNATLQVRFGETLRDSARLLVNSTLGLLGCFDVARGMGIERSRQDFGLTLGRWGVNAGPYLVLPFLGPSSLRDAVGEVPDHYTDPVRLIKPDGDYYLVYATRFVDRRSQFLSTSGLINDAALDPYQFVRDGYLQRRQARVGGPKARLSVEEDPDSPPAPAPSSPAPIR